jgi:hypothetical protein
MNILAGIAPVTASSEFYWTVALMVIFGSMKKEHPCTFPT